MTTAAHDSSRMFAADGTILRHPDRVPPRYRPLRAWKNFRLLIADKEDTSLVFKIFESLPSRTFLPRVEELALSPHGEELRRSEPRLPEILDDHAALRRTPKGSLAHAYCDFMEAEGLSAAGLVAEAESLGRPKYPDLVQWFMERSRDTHDLFHVLTGYGRDALGEQCVLLFTHGQSPSHGHLLIGYAGAANIKKMIKGSKAPVLGAVRQAHRTGKGAPRLIEQPIRELLAQPLDAVRAQMNIPAPTKYRECHRIWKAEGIDPYNLLASENAPQEMAAA
ncbi:Coq4 family protein [Erythrobacter sanguineus]|jgi:ubiquinone biosynthesis protein COQ4|uniref:Ubiquinone biosynthesis protein COQ4 n=1 Tax=Erythrobacter sanguineus TaxID=198312 RepID=A0A1M7RSN8_9SPHN|nr:Coq4 family protein [Erythrobacter sanguineus]MCR9179697.1 Coq4 family protein [Erythrobacteraceae bacterium]SHN49305.1 ubiquinone biosynthesis protein COQ4 [Erythrobacter sanguineus]